VHDALVAATEQPLKGLRLRKVAAVNAENAGFLPAAGDIARTRGAVSGAGCPWLRLASTSGGNLPTSQAGLA
jgi:hypothetical protein